MSGNRWIKNIFFGIGIIWSGAVNAQFFEAKVIESGIYKVSLEEARKLGFSDLSELTFYGFPGMLPQKLDSIQMSLQEIPSFQNGNELLVFLHGPHQIQWSPDQKISYQHHLYTDTLSYLIGKKTNPKRIGKKSINETTPSSRVLYRFYSQKEEKTNLLESGREWYSLPIRQGQSLNLNFGLRSEATEKWIISSRVMGQSTSLSTMRMLTGNQLIEEIAFSPIPSNTYGIKGDTKDFQIEFSPSGGQLSQLRFTYQGTGSNSAGFLDQVTIAVPFTRDNWRNGVFRHFGEQIIQVPEGVFAMEISDFFSPYAVEGSFSKGKSWAMYSIEDIPKLSISGPIRLDLRQNTANSAFLIIAPSPLLSSAKKLQSHKQSLGLTTSVVSLEDIFDSFGYGNRDLSAIRNFLAWEYHQSKTLKNVLILGKGTFDYKGILGGRPNLVPIYTSRSSLDPLSTYSSDDYFALLDWGQGEWKEDRQGDELLKIGIGRIPAINFSEANESIEKIISYETSSNEGDWKRNFTFVADDGDNNIHLRDAENHASFLAENHSEFLSSKLYLDRFGQEKSGTQQASAQAKMALQKALDEGTLLLNYIGHGNETTLTAEEIFKVSDLENWATQKRLAIWMTATCEFGRFDSPFIRSAAEELLFAKGKGAISLLSTGRPVFSSINFSLNQAFIQEFLKKENGVYQDLGTIYKNTKNKSQNGALNRNFALIGDPSLRLPLPELGIKLGEIKSIGEENPADTLSAFQEIILKATVIDPLTEADLSGFNGDYEIEIRDKPVEVETLGDESSTTNFQEESTLIFKGRGKVNSGNLESRFLIPKNINPQFGIGKIRILAKEEKSGQEAFGLKEIIIGGESDIPSDNKGPEILTKINQLAAPPFIFPTTSIELILELEDESGINVSAFNPNQLLSVRVNELNSEYLGNLFIAQNGEYKKGNLTTRISGLKEGLNTIEIFAWDNVGNGSKKIIEVEVRGSGSTKILSHKVYPNPAFEKANFEITHNRPDENLLLTLEIYSLNGSILFSESIRLVRAPEKIENLSWKFFQNQTKIPAKGTYIYNLWLQSELDSSSDFRSGKLVIE